ncbi:hypothetical protein [Flavobacterium adhaerens]|uniref:hypothetical protein n=1 Tax=Flavobacterium adhaerens TaxID=3149043 RepID=UPI0032B3358F
MFEYQLIVSHEYEAFLLGISLSIIQSNPTPRFKTIETKEATIFFIEFEDEDQMYIFDKQTRTSMPYLFES